MDAARFDGLARQVARTASRRRVVATMLGLGLTGVLPAIAPAAPSPTQAPNISGNTYGSMTFGYKLKWDKSWKVIHAATGASSDELILSNGTSQVTFAGQATSDAPGPYVQQAVKTFFAAKKPSSQATAPASLGGPAPETTSEHATSLDTYTTGGQQRVALFDCYQLEPGKSVLLITQDVTQDAYKAQQTPVQTLLDGLVIPLFGVKHYANLSHEHLTTRIKYPQTPPVGGPHNPVWQNCGFYDKPVANEHAVHSLEHGSVWITFVPNLPADQVAIIKQLATSIPYVLGSPYPGIPAPVIATTWGYQKYFQEADEVLLRSYIAIYQFGPDTEQGAPCSGGTSSTSF